MATVTTTFTSVAGATGTDPRAADTVGDAMVARANQAFSWTAVGTIDAGCRIFMECSDNGGAGWRVLKEWGPSTVSAGATERCPQEMQFRFRASVDNDCTLTSFEATLTESTVLINEVRSAEGALVMRATSGGVEVPSLTATTAATDTITEKTSAAGVTIDGVKCKDGSLVLTAGSVQHNNGSTSGSITQGWGKTSAEGLQEVTVEETVSFAANAALYKELTAQLPTNAVLLCIQANIESALTGGGTTAKVGLGTSSDPDAYGKTSVLTKDAKITTVPAHAVIASPTTLRLSSCAADGSAGNTALTVGSVRVRYTYRVPVDLANA